MVSTRLGLAVIGLASVVAAGVGGYVAMRQTDQPAMAASAPAQALTAPAPVQETEVPVAESAAPVPAAAPTVDASAPTRRGTSSAGGSTAARAHAREGTRGQAETCGTVRSPGATNADTPRPRHRPTPAPHRIHGRTR